ncbi:GTP-binding protein [Anseongella ginsenosidimutans]|uniref:Probable GTP-binding protein EngB n=1 Tax=Anseongella ginsenosidimutans TaxID=496056 RepID=A0A4R3KY46_9SPHI|nr:ribosome biogenesis GTP-binding protein YihA/YsxC [Anseongella ginsenosidimutans]QEC50997.1 YihA family ribosome biogenesis GTP-binding protein [Anseongella ginsenosidimutans]TCS90351.1 GTP-binding protein [Anseongella ginsenosidimutans]
MEIRSAEFICSNTKVDKLPLPDKPEHAFIGRSNVGKSSLINMLTGKRKLAKTSQTPGKTQLINHFLINGIWYMVDLPGYGYARTSKKNRRSWEGFITDYLERRPNLQCVMVLIDSRLEPQAIDLEFINWLGSRGVPFSLVFTKADKQSKQKTIQNIRLFEREMLKTWETVPEIFITSAEKQLGKEELLEFIEGVNQASQTSEE